VPFAAATWRVGGAGGGGGGIRTYVYTAVYRLRTESSTSWVFKFLLLQELSDEWSTIGQLLAGVATDAAANGRMVCPV